MPREEWRDQEAERLRDLRDRDRDHNRDPGRRDFGQADYSNLYGYDPRSRAGYRQFDDGRGPDPRAEVHGRPSDWDYGPERHRVRRDGPSDRVLWAVIMERLDDERRLDMRDIEVIVEGGEVTLNGLVRRKEDKRRVEDIADIDGVRHVQNNLRVRESSRRWMFF